MKWKYWNFNFVEWRPHTTPNPLCLHICISHFFSQPVSIALPPYLKLKSRNSKIKEGYMPSSPYHQTTATTTAKYSLCFRTTNQIKRHVSILWDEQPSICFSSLLKFRYSNKQRDSNLCSTKLRPAPQPAKPAQREYQISFLLFIIVSQTDSQADSKKNNRARASH